MDFASLRRRNKQVLVEHAFNIFLPEIEEKKVKKDYWIERLLDGYDVTHFIQDIKQGNAGARDSAISSSAVVSSSEVSSETIGSIQVVGQNVDLHAGLKRKIQVRICNYQADTFQTTPEKPLFVAYHWYRAGGEVYEFDGVRTSLKASVEQGREIEMAINLTPPAEPGDYQLMVTMVYEGRYWMEEVGLSVQRVDMTVQDYDGRGLSRHALSIFKQLQAAELEVIN